MLSNLFGKLSAKLAGVTGLGLVAISVVSTPVQAQYASERSYQEYQEYQAHQGYGGFGLTPAQTPFIQTQFDFNIYDGEQENLRKALPFWGVFDLRYGSSLSNWNLGQREVGNPNPYGIVMSNVTDYYFDKTTGNHLIIDAIVNVYKWPTTGNNTVTLKSNVLRFVFADLTDFRSVPYYRKTGIGSVEVLSGENSISLKTILENLPPEQRAIVEKRSTELIAKEMTLQSLPKARKFTYWINLKHLGK